MAQQPSVRGVKDVVALIDRQGTISGRSRVIWFLVFGGLFLDAYSNAALGAGLAPMTKQMDLSSTQVSILTATAPALAILFNPIGGWLATRIGRVPPLLLAKLFALAGAVIAATADDFLVVWIGRVLVGVAYGVDFAVAMALLAEYTPKSLRGRLNLWQGIWYIATTGNLLLTLICFKFDVGADIWRWSVGSAGVIALTLFLLQWAFLVESPTWLATKGRLEDAVRNLRRIYGIEAVAGAVPDKADAEEAPPNVGIKQAGILFRGSYLPRTLLSSAISLGQSMQYFAVGWYLPVISLAIFGNSFEKATIGSMVFNAFGIVGGLLSAYFARRLGLRISSAIGFGGVFVMLLGMGLTFDRVPTWIAFILPALFIFCHSAGPGANGKSIAALSYRSEVRTLGTGVTGMIGSFGSVAGLYLFPQIKDGIGLDKTFMVLAVVPLLGLLTCLAIRWDPTRAVSPDEDPNVPIIAAPSAGPANPALVTR
ncbi:MFS transporter [Embleya sp. NPDC055664]